MVHSSVFTTPYSTPFTGPNARVNPCPLLKQGTAGKGLGSFASNFPEPVLILAKARNTGMKALWPWTLPPRPLEAQPLSGVKK